MPFGIRHLRLPGHARIFLFCAIAAVVQGETASKFGSPLLDVAANSYRVDDLNCGVVACLATLAYFNVDAKTENVVAQVKVDSNGMVAMDVIAKFLFENGIKGFVAKVDIEKVPTGTPLILSLNSSVSSKIKKEDHFCFALKSDAGWQVVELNTSLSMQEVEDDVMRRLFKGHAIVVNR